MQTALANLARAQAQLSQAVASQQQASANYKSVQGEYQLFHHQAPISGIVGKLPLKVGSLVGLRMLHHSLPFQIPVLYMHISP